MPNDADLIEIDKRIAIIRDNIRQLIEEAAAFTGAADENRIADRIADQEARTCRPSERAGSAGQVERGRYVKRGSDLGRCG